MTATYHRLFAQQLAKATSAEGAVDIAMLGKLVSAAYHDTERDRRRTDRANTLMADELEAANAKLDELVDALSRQNKLFASALDNMSQGLCMFDAAERLMVVNNRFIEIMDLPPGTIHIGMRYEELLAAEYAAGHFGSMPFERFLAARREKMQGEQYRIEEVTQRGKRIAAVYCPMPGGGWVKTVEDVTAERASEAQAAANARLASLGEMAAGLAHELKQPLTTIVLAANNADRAAEKADIPGVRRRIERITAQALRASSLIDHLRRFARGWDDAGTLESVSLAEAVEGALTLLRGVLREATVQVTVDLGPMPPVVRGHGLAIEQVLVNLLMNACHALAAQPPEVKRRITLSAQGPECTGGAAVVMTVADNGGGIPDIVMPRLFEPFVTTKGPDRGTGLGLSICHGLMKTMGGAITARNDDEGAVFSLTLQPG